MTERFIAQAMQAETRNICIGWARTTLGDVLELVNGRAYKQEELLSSGVPVLRIQNLNGGDRWYYSNLQLDAGKYCEPGDLLYAWSATFGPYRYQGPRAIFHYHIWRVVPRTTLDTGFAYWLLKELTAEVKAAAHGVAMPHMTKAGMEAWPVSLPPLNEQRRIVAKLDALQERSRRARASLDAVPALLDKLRQSILAAAFRGDLTRDFREQHKDLEPASKLLQRIRTERRKKWEEAELAKLKAKGKAPTDDKWKAKYKEPDPVDPTGLPTLPDGWCWASLEDVSEVIDPNPSHRNPKYVPDGFPFVSTAEFTEPEGVLLDSTRKVALETVEEQELRCSFSARSILFSRKGTIGKTRLFPVGNRMALLDSLCVINPAEGLSAPYVNYALRSSALVSQLEASTRGVALPQLSVGRVRELCIPICAGLEQEELASRVAQAFGHVAALIGAVRNVDDRQTTLDRAILAKAFRGELVPQDPRDEPADELLARVRADQAAPSTPRGRKRAAEAALHD